MPAVLSLPYEIRQMIYIEIVDWVGLELILHLNSYEQPCKRPQHADRKDTALLCVARRPPFDVNVFGVDTPDLRDFKRTTNIHLVKEFLKGSREFVKKMPTGAALAEKLRYPTFLNLLSTCRQIRQEVGDLFWRHTEFNCLFLIQEPLSLDGAYRSTVVARCLQKQFAGGIISKSVRRIKFHFQRSQFDWKWHDYKSSPLVQEYSGRLANEFLDQFPNLTHVTFLIRDPEHFLDIWDYYVFSRVLSKLEKFPRPLSIHFQGAACHDILDEWKERLEPKGIKITARENKNEEDIFPPVCCTELHRPGDDHTTCHQLKASSKAAGKESVPPNHIKEAGGRLTDKEVYDRMIWIKSLGIPELEEFTSIGNMPPFKPPYRVRMQEMHWVELEPRLDYSDSDSDEA